VFARIGDPLREAVALHNLGDMFVRAGDIPSALELFEQAAGIHRAHGERAELAVNLHSLATVSVLAGRPRDALAPAAEGLRIATEFRYRMFTAYSLEVIAAALAELEDRATATRLLGAAETLRSEIGFVLQEVEKALHDRTVDALRERLGADGVGRLWREGASLREEEAVALALAAATDA
jgi:hypothetical protein